MRKTPGIISTPKCNPASATRGCPVRTTTLPCMCQRAIYTRVDTRQANVRKHGRHLTRGIIPQSVCFKYSHAGALCCCRLYKSTWTTKQEGKYYISLVSTVLSIYIDYNCAIVFILNKPYQAKISEPMRTLALALAPASRAVHCHCIDEPAHRPH